MEKSWLTYRGLWALSLPSILATMLEPISSIIDTALVGHFDTRSLAALAIGATLISSLTWMFNFLVHAPIQSISSSVGNSRFDEVVSHCKISLVLALSLGVLLIVSIYPFRFSIYRFMGADDSILSLCDDYFSVRLLGQSFILLFTVVLALLRGLARVKAVLYFISISTIFNICFSYLALYRFNMGVAGVAWATVLGNALGFSISFLYLLRVNKIKDIFWKQKIIKENVFHMGKKSLNIFGRSAFLTLSFFLSTKIAAHISFITLAAHQIVLQVWLFASFFTDGVATTGNIIGARIYKSEDKIYLKEIFNRLVKLGLVVGIFFSFFFFIAGDLIVRRFTTDETVIEVIKEVWLLIALFQIPLSVAYVYDGFVFGINRFDFLRKHMMIAFVIIFIPMAFYSYTQKSFIYVWAAIGTVGLYRLVSNYFCLKQLYKEIRSDN